MRRSGGRLAALSAVLLCATTGCTVTVAGSAVPAPVVGVTQHAADGLNELDVAVLAVLDPAPVSEADAYALKPGSGTRLVAARLKVTNRGDRDDLVGPTGRVHFVGDDGRGYDDSLLDTSAGPMFDQLSLAPGASMVGYVTVELADRVKVEFVEFNVRFAGEGPALRWRVLEALSTPPPAPPARADSRTGCHPLGEAVELHWSADGTAFRLSVNPTRIVDPAPANSRIRPERQRRLVGVEFAVRNTGEQPFAAVENDADLRTFAVFDAADQAIESHVYGASAAHGLPLPPGRDDIWTVLFEVPTDFAVDRITFTPRVATGRTTTAWAAS